MNWQEILYLSSFAIISYLIGSIPFAWLASKLLKKGDIRKKGTGNVGGGNTMAVVGKVAGTMVLLLDMLKGSAAGWLGLYLFNSTFAFMIFVLAAIIGHCNSIFLGFSGGKGVATTLGGYAMIDLKVFLLIYFIWVALVLTTKYTAVNTVIISIIYPFVLSYLGKDFYFVLYTILVAIIFVINHRSNLVQFITGKEKTMKEEFELSKNEKPRAY